ncbi:NAD(P)-binding protein, partial [Streptomyces sp. NPDC049577]|uniref:NAD(P)-binding protein n=1 Tax=Streptomyces sp. NPDC049577 TaxID=3155153 RepID=UPI00341E5C55
MGGATGNGRVARREVLRYGAAAAGAVGLGGGSTGSAVARGAGGRRVAVFGAGVGGLTVAQELAERGFEVTVHERRAVAGGKARSLYVPHSGTGGRRDLPGEHGHRGVFGFYHNLPDTLRRIPRPGGGTVFDNLTPVTRMELDRSGRRTDIPLPVRPWTPSLTDTPLLITAVAGLFEEQFRLPPLEALFFAKQLVMLFTSCDERRFGQWEYVGWLDYIRAERMSADYRRLFGGGVQLIEALKPATASSRTCGQGFEAVF